MHFLLQPSPLFLCKWKAVVGDTLWRFWKCQERWNTRLPYVWPSPDPSPNSLTISWYSWWYSTAFWYWPKAWKSTAKLLDARPLTAPSAISLVIIWCSWWCSLAVLKSPSLRYAVLRLHAHILSVSKYIAFNKPHIIHGFYCFDNHSFDTLCELYQISVCNQPLNSLVKNSSF